MLMELVAGILGLIKKGDFQKASQAIDNVYIDLLKQDASFFIKISVSELTSRLIEEHNYTSGHLEILSELFYTQAELTFAEGKKNESLLFYQKSLVLLEFIQKESRTFSLEKESRVTYLQDRIYELRKP